MKAIIDATGYRPEAAPLLYYKPSPLLCVGGKPILMHVIEFLVQQQISQFEVVLNYLPEKIEKEIGSGQRWGIKVTYHLARDAIYPFQAICPLVSHLGSEPVWLAEGDRLPHINSGQIKDFTGDKPLLFIFENRSWTGWGILPGSSLEGLSPRLAEEDLPKAMTGRCLYKEVQPFLSVQSLCEFKESNLRFLQDEHQLSIFPTAAKMVEPGIWISRGVSLHPTAKIVPPVFIGVSCQINADATVGPNAVIEDFCIIDEESDVVNSVVCKRSYVGECLNIQNCIIDRNIILNLSLETRVIICDDFILGESYPKHSFTWIFSLIERGLAALIFVLFSPIYLIMFYDHHLRRDVMLKLPANNDPLLWETISWETFELNAGRKPTLLHRIFSRLPLLKGIARGEMHFVGVIPRHPKEAEKLPPDWKRLYLKSKIGVITSSDIEGLEDEDSSYASELLYTTQKSPWHDLRLLCKWFIRKCKNIMGPLYNE